MKALRLEHYQAQLDRWPAVGRHILAQFYEETVVVYQAYRPEIGNYAVEHQRFGGPWSFGRMTWIKPNFLWMMFRCGWGMKEGQEVTLAIRLRRSGFDEILAQAAYSSFEPAVYQSHEQRRSEMAQSNVRLQWDPDHDPSGTKVVRRAIQLGLRGPLSRKFAEEWIVSIEDVSELVARQRENASAPYARATP